MKKFVVLVVALPMLAGAAHAADLLVIEPEVPVAGYDDYSLYVSLHAGVTALEAVGAQFVGGFITDPVDVTTDLGYRVGGAVGFLAGSNLAFEGEVSHVGVSLDEASNGVGTLAVDGDASALTLMANAIVGADMGGWRPYVGVGVGGANVALDVPINQLGNDSVSDNSWTWAAQAFAGLEFEVSQGVSLGARYRYQLIGETSFTDGGGDPVNLDGFGSHSLEGTLKFSM